MSDGLRRHLEALIKRWRTRADTGFSQAVLSPDEIDTLRLCADELAAVLRERHDQDQELLARGGTSEISQSFQSSASTVRGDSSAIAPEKT